MLNTKMRVGIWVETTKDIDGVLKGSIGQIEEIEGTKLSVRFLSGYILNDRKDGMCSLYQVEKHNLKVSM